LESGSSILNVLANIEGAYSLVTTLQGNVIAIDGMKLGSLFYIYAT